MFSNGVIKKCFSLFLLCLSCTFLFARGKQELVLAGSWVYDSLTAIALEEGRTDFSDEAPLSISEVLLLLDEADYDSLSESGKTEYDRIKDYCEHEVWSFKHGILSLALEPALNLEGYYKTNSDILWVYDRYSRPGLIVAPATFSCSDYFTMSTNLTLRENRSTMSRSTDYTNIPSQIGEVDANFPSTGYFSTGFMFNENTGANFRLGMGEQDVGRSLSGSIIWSRYFTGSSWANFEVYSPNIRYDMNVTEFNVDKYMYTHRMDVRFFKKVQFTAMESMLVNAPIELRFFNPWTIYHGTAAWRDYDEGYDSNNCAYMCFKASYVPVKYLRIYGLFAQDQWQTQYELTNWPDDTTPNGLGGQLGVESYIPLGKGRVHAWIEGYYADPFLYIKEDEAWSLDRSYRELVGVESSDTSKYWYEWVGSPFGPDTIACEVNAGYEVPNAWSVTLSYLFMARGELSGTKAFTLSSWPYPSQTAAAGSDEWTEAKRLQSLTTPSGTPEYVNRVAVRGTFRVTPYLSFALQPAFVHYTNYDNVEGENAFGFEAAFLTSIDFTRWF